MNFRTLGAATLSLIVAGCALFNPDNAPENQGLKAGAAENLEQLYGTYHVRDQRGGQFTAIATVSAAKRADTDSGLPVFHFYDKNGKPAYVITPRTCKGISFADKHGVDRDRASVSCGIVDAHSHEPFLLFDDYPQVTELAHPTSKDAPVVIREGEYHLFLNTRRDGVRDFALERINEAHVAPLAH